MKIFVTGANGYLGAKIFEYLTEYGYGVVGGYFGPNSNAALRELDISDRKQTERIITDCAPDVVIHAAAVAHGEDSFDLSLLKKVNIQGTRNVAEAAAKTGAKMIFLSTIGALHNVPYGRSKLEGEKIVKALSKDYLILRPSVIIGLSPNQEADLTFNRILYAIKTRGFIAEDNKWKFQPSWGDHVCEIIKIWLERGFKDSEPVYPILPEIKTRFEICQDILGQFGLKAEAVNKPRYEQDIVLDTKSLTKNGLPVYDYGTALEKIVAEIKRFL